MNGFTDRDLSVLSYALHTTYMAEDDVFNAFGEELADLADRVSAEQKQRTTDRMEAR